MDVALVVVDIVVVSVVAVFLAAAVVAVFHVVNLVARSAYACCKILVFFIKITYSKQLHIHENSCSRP